MRRYLLPLIIGGSVVLLGTSAHAQTHTWTSPLTGTTNWSAGTWTGGTPPSGGGTGINLIFTGTASSYTANNDLGNPFVFNSMSFGFVTTGITIGSLAGNSLEMGGASPFIGLPANGGQAATGTAGATISSALNLNPSSGSVTFGGPGTSILAITGAISSTGNVPITIAGDNSQPNWSFVRLTGANTFTGNVTITSGHLLLGNATALGSASNVLNINGGTLGASAAITVANNVSLNSTLNFNSTGSTLTLTGAISGNFGVRQGGLTSSVGGLTLQGDNTYTGETILDVPSHYGLTSNTTGLAPGVMTISGAAGALTNTSAVRVRAAGTFALNDATAFTGGAAGRLNNSANIFLGGGIMTLTSGGTANYNETMGNLTLESGNNAITVTANALTEAQASLGNLTRNNRATILFRGSNLGNAPGAGNAVISFSSPPTGDLIGGGGGAGTTNISILPYAIGGTTPTDLGSSLVTFDTGRVRPLSTATEYSPTITGGSTTTDNVRLTASADLFSANLTTINALVQTTGTLSNTLGGALRPTSGTILTTGAVTISAPLDFGSQEGIIYSTAAATVSGQISGSGGLTKAGAGTLTLSNAANNYSGQTTINGGTVSFNSASVFGNSTAIVAGGGAATVSPIQKAGLTSTGAGTTTLSQNITINSGFLDLITTSASSTLRLDGQISGAGGLIINTSSGTTIELTNNNNNYTGMTRIFLGMLRISNDAQLGNGGAVDIGATGGNGMVLGGDWTTSRAVTISFGNDVNTNSFTWNQNGPFGGASALTKTGAGTWNLNTAGAASTFTGGITVAGGTFNVNGYLATSASTVTVNAGATLGGTGIIDRPVALVGASTISPGGSPGTLRIDSRAATALTLSATSTFVFEINDATGTIGVNWDRLVASNSPISLPNAMTIRIIGLNGSNVPGVVPNFDSSQDYTWEFMTAPSFTGTAFGGITFTIDDQFSANNPLNGGSFSIVQLGTTGIAIQFTGVAIPEPTTVALGGIALCGAVLTARRIRHRRRALKEKAKQRHAKKPEADQTV